MRFGKGSKDLSLHEFLFPVHSKEVYFQMFGPAGFHEAQIVIPDDRFSSFVTEIKHRLRSKPVSVTLASAKLFRGSRELLRFTGDGICLALNFPRDSRGHEFASFLDDVMLSHGGWPNVIKDSRLSRSVVERAYPEHQRFREQLRHYDPQRIYRSALSERLEL